MKGVGTLEIGIYHLIHTRKALLFDLPLHDWTKIVVVHWILQPISDRILTAKHDSPRRQWGMHTRPKRSHHLRAEQNTGPAAHHGSAASIDVVGESKARPEVHRIAVVCVVEWTHRSDRHVADVETVGIHKNATRGIFRFRYHVTEEVIAQAQIECDFGMHTPVVLNE